MKRLISIALAALMALSVLSCSGAKNGGESNGATSDTSNSTASTAGQSTTTSDTSAVLTTVTEAPQPAMNISVSKIKKNYAILVWDAVEGAAKYRVFRKDGEEWTYERDTYELSVYIGDLTENTEYTFGIRALDSNKKYLDSAPTPVTFTTK